MTPAIKMTSWPTWAHHIVHVFQYEVIFVCACRFVLVGIRFSFVSSWFPQFSRFVVVELDLCLYVINLQPPRSPPTSPRAPHQCKGALRPANGKLLRRHARPSRYCEKHLTGWKTLPPPTPSPLTRVEACVYVIHVDIYYHVRMNTCPS